jgi:hypothetical protein
MSCIHIVLYGAYLYHRGYGRVRTWPPPPPNTHAKRIVNILDKLHVKCAYIYVKIPAVLTL